MAFTKLSAGNFRNLHPYTIKPAELNNIIVGSNGAGKTNFLEAVYLNSLGKSFRTSSLNQIINKDKDDSPQGAWVFGEIFLPPNTKHTIGVERKPGNKQRLHIDKTPQTSLAKLAELTPCISIQPNETGLIDSPAVYRRKQLDWLVFHVEQSFLPLWREQQKLLKQRNALLKKIRVSSHSEQQRQKKELGTWDWFFIENNKKLSALRQGVFDALLERFYLLIEQFALIDLLDTSLKLEFLQGWPKGYELSDLLSHNLDADLKKGSTKNGSHRADILLGYQGTLAREVLSRGQKKLLSVLFKLAQAMELYERTGKRPVFLIDDLFSELDKTNIKKVLEAVESVEAQAFFTCLEKELDLIKYFNTSPKVFHVEHGLIIEQKD